MTTRGRKLPAGFWAGSTGVRKSKTKKARTNRKLATVGQVKKLISKSSETKFATARVESNNVHNSAISSADLTPILPRIPQGTDDWQRIGDSIRPTRLTIKGLVSMDRTYATDNKVLLVRIVVLSAKATKNRVATTSLFGTFASELLHPNLDSGTQVKQFVGDQNDLNYPINTDVFIVHYDRIHRLAMVAADGGSLEENPAGFFRWSKTIKLPKRLSYDTGQIDPNNFCPFYGIGYSYADGTSPDSVTTRIISNTDCTLYYKDS